MRRVLLVLALLVLSIVTLTAQQPPPAATLAEPPRAAAPSPPAPQRTFAYPEPLTRSGTAGGGGWRGYGAGGAYGWGPYGYGTLLGHTDVHVRPAVGDAFREAYGATAGWSAYGGARGYGYGPAFAYNSTVPSFGAIPVLPGSAQPVLLDRVRAILASDPAFRQLSAETIGSVVMVTGRVRDAAVSSRVAELINAIPGVSGVIIRATPVR